MVGHREKKGNEAPGHALLDPLSGGEWWEDGGGVSEFYDYGGG